MRMYELSAGAGMKAKIWRTPRRFAHQTSMYGEFPVDNLPEDVSTTPRFQSGAETLGDGPLATVSPILT